jgi:acyl dehydratase
MSVVAERHLSRRHSRDACDAAADCLAAFIGQRARTCANMRLPARATWASGDLGLTDQPTPADIDSVISPEVRSWIGRSTEPMRLPEEISASDVRRYVNATGDRNPLWLDDDFARTAGYKARVLPPMMVIDLSWRLEEGASGRLWHHHIPLPPNYVDTRNAENEIEWLSEVYIGETLVITHRVTDIVARAGRRGLGIYITRETEFRAGGGRLVARLRQTVVRFPKAAVKPDSAQT